MTCEACGKDSKITTVTIGTQEHAVCAKARGVRHDMYDHETDPKLACLNKLVISLAVCPGCGEEMQKDSLGQVCRQCASTLRMRTPSDDLKWYQVSGEFLAKYCSREERDAMRECIHRIAFTHGERDSESYYTERVLSSYGTFGETVSNEDELLLSEDQVSAIRELRTLLDRVVKCAEISGQEAGRRALMQMASGELSVVDFDKRGVDLAQARQKAEEGRKR